MKKLLTFFALISKVLTCEEQLIDYATESVGAGSYKYYSLMHEGFIRIKLESVVGDADLYVSEITNKPTYDPHQYCIKSVTCGDDTVLIPDSFKRPVTIGVYGHPLHNTSEFRISVFELLGSINLSYDQILGGICKSYKSQYENQMFLEILHEDGLVVSAKGLGLETVFANILKAFTDPGNLVIVLGTINQDEQYFIDMLISFGMKQLPRVVTSECSADERQIMYLEGGILFLSGPILVLDLLKSRLPLNLITGILVYRAHNILNSYQETFALRLYRQHNKTGFIKAFTNSALAFTVGYSQVERVMKALFVKKLYLWPRFHSLVNNSLAKLKPDVIELHLKITSKMVNIQTALLDIMNFIVKELKRLNKYLDLDELTVENAIAKKFHKQLQQQLDPVWHQLSSTTKQLISDLKMLRSLLTTLTHEDCVTFYGMLNRLRTMEYAEKNSGWLMLDSVDNLFTSAKERVYNDKNEFKPEINPKWTALSEVLLEIQEQRQKEKDFEGVERILILVRDSSTCHQLRNYLTMGAQKYLSYEALKKLPKSELLQTNKEKGVTTEKVTESEAEIEEDQDSYILTLTQETSQRIASESSEQEQQHQTLFEDCSQLGELDLTNIKTTAPIVIIEALKKNGDATSLLRTLTEYMPRNVIMYATDISAVRQLEVYQNNNPSVDLKVFFLIYKGSVEEQEYLTSLRREKEAFHLLINTKTTMVVPEDQDGKSEDCLAFGVETNDQTEEESTRKGGIPAQPKIDTVIVDMREFRSELPSILYSRGMKIEPITLQIGDYILSPEICVERKSVSDLIGSLNSGRLYNQATAMSRHYAKPMLLIEFDPNKPFCFQGHYYASKDIQNFNVTAKLQLLTLHFPRLKLVWSPGPHATAQLFEELKQGKEQPNATKAAQIGIENSGENNELKVEKYNARIQDFIAKLPGVTTKNLPIILNKGISLTHLIGLSQDELADMIGNKNEAYALYNALHEKTVPAEQNAKQSVKKVPKGRGKRIFTKIKQ